MMDRICFCLFFAFSSHCLAEEVALPKKVPPFALGDFCVASVVDHDGEPAIRLEMFGLRSRTVDTGDPTDVPIVIDGRVANKDPFVRDTFSPSRHRTVESAPTDGFAVWNAAGTKLKNEDLPKHLSSRRRAVIVNRDITAEDVDFLRYFGDDILFIRRSQISLAVEKARR
jgi:hypothetical protein